MNGISHCAQPRLECPPRRWAASLDLRFAELSGRTRLSYAAHHGPLRIQRLFHPDPDGTAHCYLLHPPGGVAGGDELSIDVDIASGAALLTTPSAGRFYRVGDIPDPQRQQVRLSCSAGARLAWLPQETLLYPGANARLDTDIDLHGDADLHYWDILVLGRPAAGERFHRGRCEQRIRLRIDGRLQLSEVLRLEAGDRLSTSALGLDNCSTQGIYISRAQPDRAAGAAWLESMEASPERGAFSLTQRGPLLIARYLGEDAAKARAGFTRLWLALAAGGAGAPSVPRIWHT
jgi:urease accessory protein